MNKLLHPFITILLEAGKLNHSRNLKYDREGYPGPAWHPSEVCAGSVAVCDKWKTRRWESEDGRGNIEFYGELDNEAECNCGAEEHNKRLMEVAEKLNSLINTSVDII